ncbi:hypothetical protein AA906_04960 [Geobacillus stearothermophilus]|nr:hypothetical protein AA906_04960 [Geobacillus stearothermophilus]
MVYQAVSQYTPSRYVPIELLHLFTQMISLDISQRSIFVPPVNFSLNSSNLADTFYFPGILYQLVPQVLKPLYSKGLEALVELEWDGHELISLNIVGKSKWVDRTLAVGLRKGAGGKGIEH